MVALGNGCFTGNNFIGILFLKFFRKSGSTYLGGCYERDKNRVEIKKTDFTGNGLFLLVLFHCVGTDKCLGFSQRISVGKTWIKISGIQNALVIGGRFAWALTGPWIWQNQKAISSGNRLGICKRVFLPLWKAGSKRDFSYNMV